MNTASSLKMSYNKSLPQNRDISAIVEHAIKNFENHSSIVAIKNDRNPGIFKGEGWESRQIHRF